MFGSVTSSVVVPESCKRLLMLWVRSGVRVDGCRDRVGLLSVKNLSMSKKKWKGALLGNQLRGLNKVKTRSSNPEQPKNSV